MAVVVAQDPAQTLTTLNGAGAANFFKRTLEWDAANLKVTNVKVANRFVRRRYRQHWEVEGL